MLSLILYLFILQKGNSCELNGYESGYCASLSDMAENLDFCYSDVQQNFCAPLNRQLWPEHTISARDSQIRFGFINEIKSRLVQELNSDISIVLTKDDTCFKAYKQFICSWNFPKCNIETQQTLPVCQSICQDYYNSCGLDITPCLQRFQRIKPGLDSEC